jgi:hypothetical protein
MNQIVTIIKAVLKESGSLYWELLKIMIPVLVVIRLAVLFGAIEALAGVIAPVMHWVGLPGEMGVVWVTAMTVNIYAGAAALLALLPGHPLTIAQATVLGSMILIAHSMPIEGRIAQKAGAGLLFTTMLRLAGALTYGFVLTRIYSGLDVLSQPAVALFLPNGPPPADWLGWAVSSGRSLISIFWIILALIFCLKLLDVLKITPWIARALAPFLRIMGISDKATSMTMAGTLLGLSYGGGLIIKEARSGGLTEKDIFLSLSFMCLCHSLIEDTLFVMTFGGHWSGLLIGRFLFSLLMMMILAKIVHKLSQSAFRRYLFRAN